MTEDFPAPYELTDDKPSVRVPGIARLRYRKPTDPLPAPVLNDNPVIPFRKRGDRQ